MLDDVQRCQGGILRESCISEINECLRRERKGDIFLARHCPRKKDQTMAVALGKRKRRSENVSDHTTAQASESVDDNQDLQDIFRRAFEAKFKPLEVVKKKSKSEEYDEAVKAVAIEAEESDWSGFSEREDAVQVVEVGTSRYEENTSRTRESRSFMVHIFRADLTVRGRRLTLYSRPNLHRQNQSLQQQPSANKALQQKTTQAKPQTSKTTSHYNVY